MTSTYIICDVILEKIVEAMEKSGKSRYQIAKDTGIDEAVLCRIASGDRGCRLSTADILCKYLGLEFKPTEKKGR